VSSLATNNQCMMSPSSSGHISLLRLMRSATATIMVSVLVMHTLFQGSAQKQQVQS
jgi:hypothetical protein